MAVRCFGPLRPILMVLTAFFVLAQLGSSQAACLGSGTNLPPNVIANLQANPGSLFQSPQGAPLGNAELISKVRDLATSDKAALKVIIDALKFASADEQSAIGTALGQAAQACLVPDPDLCGRNPGGAGGFHRPKRDPGVLGGDRKRPDRSRRWWRRRRCRRWRGRRWRRYRRHRVLRVADRGGGTAEGRWRWRWQRDRHHVDASSVSGTAPTTITAGTVTTPTTTTTTTTTLVTNVGTSVSP